MSRFTQGPVDVAPQQAGYDPARLARLEDHFARLVESGKLQGASFLLARHGKVFAHEAIGRLTPDAGSGPLRTDSLRPIASVSKVFTATAIMKLVEDGLIWLDQPVKAILPEFDTPMHGEIRISHLLTHTSGLRADSGYYGEPYPVPEPWAEMAQEDWLRKVVLAGPTHARPGERWDYCTPGFATLAEIVSRVSGRHFNAFVEQEIFQPLGMTRSFLEVPEPLWPEVCLCADWQREMLPRARARTGAPFGGFGVHSTLHDLFRFGQCFLDGGRRGDARLLGKKTVQEMTRNQLTGVPAFHWGKRLRDFRHGLGWGFFADGSTVGPATYNHEGWGWCGLYVDPVEQFIYVFFTPDAGNWRPELVVEPRTIAFSGIL